MHSRPLLLLTLLASTSPALAQFFSTQVDEPLPEATFTTTSGPGAEQTTTELPPATFITSPSSEPSSESEASTESDSGSGFSTGSDVDSETSTDSVATLTVPAGFITESPTGSTTYIVPTETGGSSVTSDDDDDDSEDQDDEADTPSTTSAASTTLSTTVNIEDLVTDTSSPTPTGGAGAITLDPVVLFACAALGLAGYGAAF